MRLEAGSERSSMVPRAVVVMVRERSMVMVRLGHGIGEGSIFDRQEEEDVRAQDYGAG